MNASEKFQELFHKLDEAAVFESYLTEDELREFEMGTGGNPRLVNLLAKAETYAFIHNDPQAGIKLGVMARLVADNLDADFSA